MGSGAIPTDRGCGRRVRGGVYLEVGVGPGGVPLESLIIDHPIPVPHRQLGVTPRGVHMVENPWEPGGKLLLDWIGSRYYPNVLDFIEEARRFGISRRVPVTFDFSSMRFARIAFMHERAAVENPDTYWGNFELTKVYCPTQNEVHLSPGYRKAGGPCAGFWWDDVVGGKEIDPEMGNRVVRRTMPSFSYLARRRPADADPIYTPAIFMTTPGLARFVYIEERPGDGCPDWLAAKLNAAQMPWEVVPE